MATYDLEEQEQLAELKAWWKQHGNMLVNVLTVASLVVIAWQGWGWYQRSQSGQSSMVYHILQKAVQDKDTQRIKAASGELLEKFSGSTYAPLGALTSAKAFIDAGDAKTAKAQLLWAGHSPGDPSVRVARLDLSMVRWDSVAAVESMTNWGIWPEREVAPAPVLPAGSVHH